MFMLTSREIAKKTMPSTENKKTSDRLSEAVAIYLLKKYLRSPLFDGVGPVIAGRIVSAFGIRTVEVIETSLHELLNVQGVGQNRMLAIKKGWTIQKQIKKALAEIIELGHIN